MCCLFGVLDYGGKLQASQRLRMVKELGKAAEFRGTDATGIAFFQRDRLCVQKAPKPAHRMRYHIPGEARYIMGHTRMTTQGSERNNQNNHPFIGRFGDTTFALAHNGVLYNDRELQRCNHLPKTNIETDSYVAVQLIERQKEVSPNSLRRMAEQLDGHFTFTVLDQRNNLYFIKGNNPLTIYHYPQIGLYLYASTTEILEMATEALDIRRWAKKVIQPRQGEILCIDCYGQRSMTRFDDIRLNQFTRWFSAYDPYDPMESEYWDLLMEIAPTLGVPEEEVQALALAGYSAFDTEELLYDDYQRACCLDAVKCELRAW